MCDCDFDFPREKVAKERDGENRTCNNDHFKNVNSFVT